MKELSKSTPDLDSENDIPHIDDENESNQAYSDALASDPVARCRSLVTTCRASGQRREELMNMIKEGNTSNAWGKEDEEDIRLREVQLLRDVDTRWSSTFLMIDRVLELYPASSIFSHLGKLLILISLQAIDAFLKQVKQKDITHHALHEIELEVLGDICKFLEIPHSIQELLSAEKTPTLSWVLPEYENMLCMLRDFREAYPQLRRTVSTSIAKIEEYVAKSRKTRIYALAMSKWRVLS